MATAYVCKACGVQHATSEQPPDRCLICEDERQYVGWGGQQWTALEEMRAAGHANRIQEVEPGLWSVTTRPRFAIGQQALLAQTAGGNFLWDCISYIDDATIERVHELGGLAAISASHPHFYGIMIEWAHAFGARVYLPEADREWLVRPDPAVVWYEGAVEPIPRVTLVQCGGHFDGSAVLHWAAGAGGHGALLTGDTIAVAADRRYVTFMRSYPNYIPLPAKAVRGIVEAVRPYEFDRIHGGWWGLMVATGAKEAIERSAARYIDWLGTRAGD